MILTPSFTLSFAQTAVVIAMYFKLKDTKLKSLCPPAIISGIFGVTEPAIYGITLPKKMPFIYSMIGCALGGAALMYFKVTSYTMGGLGVFGFFNFITPKGDASAIVPSVVITLLTMLISFLLTYFFWKDDEVIETTDTKESTPKLKIKNETMVTPVVGKVSPLSTSSDEAFANGLLGKGVLIHPEKGEVYAPFDGTVMILFPTKHAIGLISDTGLEVLIHIGIDTVQLDGKYFESFVQQGQKVKQGDLLVSFDIEKITEAGYKVETPVLVTNADDYLDIVENKQGNIKENEVLLTVLA